MGYGSAITGRYLTGKAMKKRGKPEKTEEAPPEKKHFPFYYAILMMAAFYFLTGGKQDYLLPSIIIPLILWFMVRRQG